MNTQTNTIIDSISNDAKEIYWNAVNIINLEYKDILMDIEKHIDHVSYSNFISMLTSREKIYDEVIRKLKVTESLVYNLCGELMSVRSLIEKAKDYVVNSNYTKESNDAVDVFWDAVCYIDSNFKDILCLLEEHLELLELTGDPIERWSEWYSYERALLKTITENYMNRYSISNEIVFMFSLYLKNLYVLNCTILASETLLKSISFISLKSSSVSTKTDDSLASFLYFSESF